MKFVKSLHILLVLSLALGFLASACDLTAINPGGATPTPGSGPKKAEPCCWGASVRFLLPSDCPAGLNAVNVTVAG